MAGRILWALSNEIVLDYEEIFTREMSPAKAMTLLEFIELVDETRGVIRYLSPDYRFLTIPADADDDKFVHVALAAKARWLVTGDSDLLTLRQVEDVVILTPAQAVRTHS